VLLPSQNFLYIYTLFVCFIVPPKIISHLTTVIVGEKVRIKCFTFGEVVWRFNNGPIPDNAIEMKESQTLLIVDVSVADEGTYKCYLKKYPSFNASTQLIVIGKYTPHTGAMSIITGV